MYVCVFKKKNHYSGALFVRNNWSWTRKILIQISTRFINIFIQSDFLSIPFRTFSFPLFFFPGFLLLNTHILIGHIGTKCQNWIRDILKRRCYTTERIFRNFHEKQNEITKFRWTTTKKKNQTVWYEK